MWTIGALYTLHLIIIKLIIFFFYSSKKICISSMYVGCMCTCKLFFSDNFQLILLYYCFIHLKEKKIYYVIY